MHVHRGVTPGVITGPGQAWARSLRFMPPAMYDTSNHAALTSGNAGYLENESIKVGGWQGGQ